MNKKLAKRAEETLRRLDPLIRHIRSVQENALVLGEKLIKNGEIDLGRQLIALAFKHDNSKFYGLEFDFLTGVLEDGKTAKLKLKLAIEHHQNTNEHHPNFWNSIHNMPDVFLAEFVIDSAARSQEFGSDIREWIENNASQRWNFNKNDEVYKKIMYFVDLLYDKPFVEVK